MINHQRCVAPILFFFIEFTNLMLSWFQDSGVRIAAMGIFCVVTFIFTIILVVLLAID